MLIKTIRCLLKELEKSNTERILTGDLNINLLKINYKPIFNEFFDTVISHSFYPKITLPTRLTTRRGTLLDNFYCKLSTATSTCKRNIRPFPLPYVSKCRKEKHIIKEKDYVATPKLSPLDIIDIMKKLSEDTILNY